MKLRFKIPCLLLIMIFIAISIVMLNVFSVDCAQENNLKVEAVDEFSNFKEKCAYIVPASYERNTSAYISMSEGNIYTASIGGASVTDGDLSSLLAMVECDGMNFIFSNVTYDAGISFSKNITLCGDLALTSGNLTTEGKVILDGFYLSLSSGSLRIKSGIVDASSGSISSLSEPAFLLDYSSSANLLLKDFSVFSESALGCVVTSMGSTHITGGRITNSHGPAVKNSATLSVSGEPQISGLVYDIISDKPIHLSYEDKHNEATFSLKIEKSFPKGSFSEVLLLASESDTSRITLYDALGEKIATSFFEEIRYSDERNFCAVYRPHFAKFYVGETLSHTAEFLNEEILQRPEEPSALGYKFDGWYKDIAKKEPYSFGDFLYSDINLYGAFSLMPPTFSINSLEFVYDASSRFLEFSELSHPLSDGGSFSYVWYKDSEPLSVSTNKIKITNVSDSGDYYCKLTFAYNGDFVISETPIIKVNIEKMTVNIPVIPAVPYTGSTIAPDVFSEGLYTSFCEGGINVGTYPITLSLTDPSNMKWSQSSLPSVNITFDIIKSENKFLTSPTVKDTYVGIYPEAFAETLFGVCEYLYSRDALVWQKELPDTAGKYYIIATVSASENYYELRSEILEFNIKEELCIGIKIDKAPTKTEYRAFEMLILDGAVFTATYNSGRSDILPHENITVEYKNGTSFRVFDTSAIVKFGSASVPIAVNITPAQYDISGLIFEDKTVTYNGLRHTIEASLNTVGLDGIPLLYSVSGGGVDAGEYNITLSFKSESVNYCLPGDINATLTVNPMPVTVKYQNLSFIYDGEQKLPLAEITLAEGISSPIILEGAAFDAGIYKARAVFDNKNYLLLNPTADFEIKKADIDLSGIRWNIDSVSYNGSIHNVFISGLPANVTLAGYANASFRDAGEYTASATIIYDTKNYNPPAPITHIWRITPIEYDMSGFSFVGGSIIYDGNMHYPTTSGEIPTGLDGSTFSYSFSGGVKNVSDGEMEITVSFISGSKNYLAPQSMCVNMKILPREISVIWQSSDFIYNGEPQAPSVICSECEIFVTGAGVDAGEYTAAAISSDENYKVINESFVFVIEKAFNYWIVPPSISDVFEGRVPEPFAEAYFGDIEYSYFSDGSLMESAVPAAVGKYYAVASVGESKNYKRLVSAVLTFEIIEVVPLEFRVEWMLSKIVAMKEISAEEIKAYYINNDGTHTQIPLSELEIKYQNGSLPKVSDTEVGFKIGEFEIFLPVEVEKASYDMSGAYWTKNKFTYDGSEKSAELLGLPAGVSVSEYKFSQMQDAGTYPLIAVLSYDSENYHEPKAPPCELLIEKCIIELPDIENAVYCGTLYKPKILETKFYTFEVPNAENAGIYKVKFTISDPKNYDFKDGVDEKTFEIEKIDLVLKVKNNQEFSVISGEIIDGDDLFIEFYTEDGYIYMRADNPNYKITVIPTKAKLENTLVWFIISMSLALLLLALGLFLIISNRKREVKVLAQEASVLKNDDKLEKSKELNELKENQGAIFENNHIATNHTEKNRIEKNVHIENPVLKTLLAVDEEHANSLIPDFLAKNLVSDEKTTVKTRGRRRAIVNIDTISESFRANDTVDINSMKEIGIIPKDARYVKVLARGVIDKPINIIANSYSLAAVKMIALTGGTAKRAHTSKI